MNFISLFDTLFIMQVTLYGMNHQIINNNFIFDLKLIYPELKGKNFKMIEEILEINKNLIINIFLNISTEKDIQSIYKELDIIKILTELNAMMDLIKKNIVNNIKESEKYLNIMKKKIDDLNKKIEHFNNLNEIDQAKLISPVLQQLNLKNDKIIKNQKQENTNNCCQMCKIF